MSHHQFDESDIEFLSVPVPKRRRPESVLLHLDLFLGRDELAHMNVFLGRNAETVRLLGADGEHVEFDVAEATKFLTALVKNCDRATGLVIWRRTQTRGTCRCGSARGSSPKRTWNRTLSSPTPESTRTRRVS